MPIIVAPPTVDTNLAAVADLATLLRRSFSAAEEAAAELILSGVSATIRSFTHQYLSRVDGESITRTRGRGYRTFWLPEVPVISVASITIDGVLVPSTSYRVDLLTGEVRFSSLIGSLGTRTCFDPSVTVVYSHGFDPVPDDIAAVAREMAIDGVELPDGGIETKETIGNYSVELDVDRVRVLNDSQKARLSPYRMVVVA